jgi:Arc/MetJ family transcription regulator
VPHVIQHPFNLNIKNQQIKRETMTTIVLDDDLINKVVQIGNYQTPQEVVVAILSDYVQTHQPQKALFDKSYLYVDMADGEIDSLFERDKDVGEI